MIRLFLFVAPGHYTVFMYLDLQQANGKPMLTHAVVKSLDSILLTNH